MCAHLFLEILLLESYYMRHCRLKFDESVITFINRKELLNNEWQGVYEVAWNGFILNTYWYYNIYRFSRSRFDDPEDHFHRLFFELQFRIYISEYFEQMHSIGKIILNWENWPIMSCKGNNFLFESVELSDDE